MNQVVTINRFSKDELKSILEMIAKKIRFSDWQLDYLIDLEQEKMPSDVLDFIKTANEDELCNYLRATVDRIEGIEAAIPLEVQTIEPAIISLDQQHLLAAAGLIVNVERAISLIDIADIADEIQLQLPQELLEEIFCTDTLGRCRLLQRVSHALENDAAINTAVAQYQEEEIEVTKIKGFTHLLPLKDEKQTPSNVPNRPALLSSDKPGYLLINNETLLTNSAAFAAACQHLANFYPDATAEKIADDLGAEALKATLSRSQESNNAAIKAMLTRQGSTGTLVIDRKNLKG